MQDASGSRYVGVFKPVDMGNQQVMTFCVNIFLFNPFGVQRRNLTSELKP